MSDWPWLILVGVYGACVGSFLNVVIYRLPEGQSLVRPGSRCPRCGHGLAMYDNVPVLGWLWLRGRCRYCRTRISVQYPLIEALCAVLFMGMYWVDYHSGQQPGFGYWGVSQTWPALLVQLTMIAGLVAATAIDARYYIIPLGVTHLVTAVAMVVVPVSCLWQEAAGHTAPVVGPNGVGASIGGIAGLMLAITLMWFKILPRSFDEDPMEPSEEPTTPSAEGDDPSDSQGLLANLLMILPLIGATAGLGWWAWGDGRLGDDQPYDLLIYVLSGVMVGYFIVGLLYGAMREPDEASDVIGEYPNPRREVLKEALFLMLPVIGAVCGYQLTKHLNEGGLTLGSALVWRVLGGVLMGYLVGGGVIWGVRVLGTLAFGKEAMGLGDVHLLAAIGAVIGAKHGVIVFFLAPFFGLASAAGMMVMSRVMQVSGRVIPYGPYLAGAAVAVMAMRDSIERVFVIFSY